MTRATKTSINEKPLGLIKFIVPAPLNFTIKVSTSRMFNSLRATTVPNIIPGDH
jgi:hypothetical protein